MHHRLHVSSDRLETGQPQQVHGRGAQRAHRAGAIVPVAVGIFMELGVPNPVPALNAPAVAYQSQQGFWGGAQAFEKQVGRPKWLAFTDAIGGHLDDPAGANPGLKDVLWCLFGA